MARTSGGNNGNTNRPKITAKKKRIFCDVIESTGNVTKAARIIGMSKNQMYHRARPRNPDGTPNPTFDEELATMWADAIEAYKDNLEEEAHRRAYGGTDKPIIYKGEITDTYKEKSDTMMIFLLKAEREKFAEQLRSRVEMSGGLHNTNANVNANMNDANIAEEDAVHLYKEFLNAEPSSED